jgi:hypothetical protein
LPGFDDSAWDSPSSQTDLTPLADSEFIADVIGPNPTNTEMQYRLNFTNAHPVSSFVFTHKNGSQSSFLTGNNVAVNVPGSIVVGANLIALMYQNAPSPSLLCMDWRLEIFLFPFIDGFVDTAFVGGAFSRAALYGGGTPPYRFRVSVGTLPPGLYLNADNALVYGVAVAPGVFNFTIEITDARGVTAAGACTITVTQPQYGKIPFGSGGGGGFGGGAGGLGGGSGGPGNPALPVATGAGGPGAGNGLPVIPLPWCMKRGCIVT